MNKDGTMNSNAGDYNTLDRFECRDKLWKDLETAGLIIKIDDTNIGIKEGKNANLWTVSDD